MPTELSAWLLWICLCFGFAALVGLLSGGPGSARWLGAGVAGCALVCPFLIQEGTVLRAAVALQLVWVWLKAIDLARDSRRRSAGFRVVQLLVLHDLRRDAASAAGQLQPRPELRLRLLGSSLAWGAAAAPALWLALFGARELAEPAGILCRYAAGLAFAYAGVEGALGAFEFVYRAGGLCPPVLHQQPILSASISEFWGKRWNRIVGNWLFSSFYRPFALRRQAWLGAFAAFAASALLHLYFTWAAIGLGGAVLMAAFFLAQVPLLWLEQRWYQAGWPSPLRRLWTLGWLALTSPLFIEPMLRIIEGGFG
ncbi:MAG TPA: MBOAT family protein [Polyangiaceae bacterium]|nr:MBOAT family protein [Polyangiaceae bacterium]